MERSTFIFGCFIGFMVAFVIISIPGVESAIPPTRAFQNINVSLPWFGAGNHLVESESSSDTVNFVSDGSITFNVTSTYP